MKSIYFFGLGTFTLYSWNSILNLNDVFVESFENPEISKVYTLGYFILSFPAFIATIYIDKQYSIYTFIRLTLLAILVLFTFLYIICRYLQFGIIKYLLFVVTVILIGNCDILVGNLGTGLSSRFKGNENSYKFLGKAFSGLFCNLIMVLDLLVTRTSNNNSIFLMFVVIGNILLILFLFIQERIFKQINNKDFSLNKSNNDDIGGKLTRDRS